jgi:hypothetical protein
LLREMPSKVRTSLVIKGVNVGFLIAKSCGLRLIN